MASIITSRASSGLRGARVLVHHARQQRLVQRAPVHADPHRLLVFDGALHHGAEVVVVLAADRDVSGVDAIFRERPGASRVLPQQQVAVVVEVAHNGRGPALFLNAFNDIRHRLRCIVVVHGDADQFGAGAGKRGNLLDGGLDIGGVGVGHRLHDYGGF